MSWGQAATVIPGKHFWIQSWCSIQNSRIREAGKEQEASGQPVPTCDRLPHPITVPCVKLDPLSFQLGFSPLRMVTMEPGIGMRQWGQNPSQFLLWGPAGHGYQPQLWNFSLDDSRSCGLFLSHDIKLGRTSLGLCHNSVSEFQGKRIPSFLSLPAFPALVPSSLQRRGIRFMPLGAFPLAQF